MNEFNNSNWTGRTPRTSNEAFGLRYRKPEYREVRRKRSLSGEWVIDLCLVLVLAVSVGMLYVSATS